MLRSFALGGLLLGFVASSTPAQTTYTWSGLGGNANWSTAANWSAALTSHPTNTAIQLAGTTNTSTVVDSGVPTSTIGGTTPAFEMFRLTFAANAGPFTVASGTGGPPLRISGIGGGITVESGNTANHTISVPLLVGTGGGSHTWTHNGSGLLTVSGSVTMGQSGFGIVGSGNVTVSGVMSSTGAFNGIAYSGTGTLTLSAANTYGGTTNVFQGTLMLDGGNNRLPTGTTLNLGSATAQFFGTLDLNGRSQQLAGLLSQAGNADNRVVSTAGGGVGTLRMANTTNQTFAGTLGGTNGNGFGLTKVENGVFSLTRANTYTGPTLIQSGTVKLSGTGSFANSAVITVGEVTAATAFLDVATTGTNPLTGGLNFDTGTAQFALTTGQTLQGAGRGVIGGVTVRGGSTVTGYAAGTTLNTLTVSGNVTIVGGTTAAGGKISTTVRDNGGTVTNTTLTVGGVGNDLDFVNLGPGKFELEIRNAGGLQLGQSYTVTIANAVDTIRRNGTVVSGSFTFNPNDYNLSSPDFPAFANVSLFTVGTDLRLTFTPVPEPGTVFAVGAAALAGGVLVRRRQRRRETV